MADGRMMATMDCVGDLETRTFLYKDKEGGPPTMILTLDNFGGCLFLHCNREGLEKLKELAIKGLKEWDEYQKERTCPKPLPESLTSST